MATIACSGLREILSKLNNKKVEKVTDFGESLAFTDGSVCVIEHSDEKAELIFDVLPGFTFRYNTEIQENESNTHWEESVTDGKYGKVTFKGHSNPMENGNLEYVTLSFYPGRQKK